MVDFQHPKLYAKRYIISKCMSWLEIEYTRNMFNEWSDIKTLQKGKIRIDSGAIGIEIDHFKLTKHEITNFYIKSFSDGEKTEFVLFFQFLLNGKSDVFSICSSNKSLNLFYLGLHCIMDRENEDLFYLGLHFTFS
jgi:hypothetical protein